ncbi:hypothetical protein [Roseofilum casamattae]|uniref:hypothetical protein n=1 Tax=Roseofilum casamattae TaxID=3082944 RepID=UPI0024BD70D9|nr:hypothetical protein [Roseofilum casamattae]
MVSFSILHFVVRNVGFNPDRFFDILGPLPPDAVIVGICQIILGHCPILGKLLPGIDLQNQLVNGDRIFPFSFFDKLPIGTNRLEQGANYFTLR